MTSRIQADIAVIGGGVGGCAAALAAARSGMKVLLSEETDWIGGQLTSQLVPPDEHRYIEQFGCTASYREFRNRVRRYYRDHMGLRGDVLRDPVFSPGRAIVNRLAFDPRVALAVLRDMLAPYLLAGRIQLLMNRRPIDADMKGGRVMSVTLAGPAGADGLVRVEAAYFLDATECGDLLPLTGTEYVTGAESHARTGEPHALAGEAEPSDVQAFTYCFAMDYREGENHVIPRPDMYDFWRSYRAPFQQDRMLSWTPLKTNSGIGRFSLFDEAGAFPLWRYRRIADASLFEPGLYGGDITVVNWPQNDYWLGDILECTPEERSRRLWEAKQLSLSLLYWLQTEAPRPDGGQGYPGLRLRKDVAGTEDGLAKYPYIRESRRIKADFTVLEQHINPELHGGGNGLAEKFPDSVGIGCYRIDLHPTSGGREGFYLPSLPFQIPLGCLIPVRTANLLPASKNAGVTHLTNGCFRLHPVEWNIGEASGALAAFCLAEGHSPRKVRNEPSLLAEFQQKLIRLGVELEWPVMGPV